MSGAFRFPLRSNLRNVRKIARKWFMPLKTKNQPLEFAALLFLRIGLEFVNVNNDCSLDNGLGRRFCSHRRYARDGQDKPCYDLLFDITAEFRRRETRCGHRPRSDSKLIYCNER